MKKDFFINSQRRGLSKVLYSNGVIGGFGGLNISWGIENCGFGQYYISKKGNDILIDNECMGKIFIKGVLNDLFYNMIHIEKATFKEVVEELSSVKVNEIFNIPSKIQVLLNIHEVVYGENFDEVSIIENSDFEKIVIKIKKNIINSDDDFYIDFSDLLRSGNCEDFLISAKKITTEVTQEKDFFDKNLTIKDVNLEVKENEINIVYDHDFGKDFFTIKNYKNLSIVVMDNVNISRNDILSVVDFLVNKSKLSYEMN